MEENQEQPGVQNPAHMLARKLQENRKSLHIARIPEKTKEAFIALAEEEFCGDYGMTLKWLIDDIPSQDTRMIIAKLEDHEARLQALESVNNPPSGDSDESIKMLDGKTLVRRPKKNG
jgi:hypothetical protein